MEKSACKIIDNENRHLILSFVSVLSSSLLKYTADNSKSSFTLYYKAITHSDLISSGKCMKKYCSGEKRRSKQLEQNLLYYLSTEQMYKLEKKKNKHFPSAHQTSIYIGDEFFEQLGMKILERREGAQKEEHPHDNINEFVNVLLVTDTVKFFNFGFTNQIFDKLEKKTKWKKNKYTHNIDATEPFIRMDLHHTIHGIGAKSDYVFKILRHNMFVGDIIALLVEEKENSEKNVFVCLGKNKLFFDLLNIKDTGWFNFLKQEENNSDRERSESRSGQGAWRDLLATESMIYEMEENEISCPITRLTCNYENMGTLFRASHIKPYSTCSDEEKYDPNNGLLLSVSADALFDKHLISIDGNKNVVFSCLITANMKRTLSLCRKDGFLNLELLNDERMKYLKLHYEEFLKLEKRRTDKNV